jgi:hypothetical protein
MQGRTDIDSGCFVFAMRQTLSGWMVARNATYGLGNR